MEEEERRKRMKEKERKGWERREGTGEQEGV